MKHMAANTNPAGPIMRPAPYSSDEAALIPFIDAKSGRPVSRVAPQATIEDRLEATAARGDRAVYSGPSLGEMGREQRHKLLYGE
jgi:hypothetical protein